MTIEEKLADCLFDAIDARKALSDTALNQLKDAEGTETTVGDCLDNIIETLQEITY